MKFTINHYVEALRASVDSADDFRHILDDLASVVEHLSADERARSFFTSKTISPKQQETVLREVFHDYLATKTYGFLGTLLRNGQFALLDRIIARAERIIDLEEGTARVVVTSAAAIKDSVREQIETILAEKVHRRILATYSEQPETIAGFRVTIDGNIEWDGTVAGRLARLRAHIQQI